MRFVGRGITNSFQKLGYTVAVYPKYFIGISVTVSLLLATGILETYYGNDIQRYFAATNGPGFYEKSEVLKYFPANYSGSFSASRITEIGRLARIIITVKDNGNLFRSSIWKEITLVDEILHNVSISYDNANYNYSTLCATLQDNCYENDYIDLDQIMDRVESGSVRLVYPLMVNPETYNTHFLPVFFSGLGLSPDNLTLLSAEAVTLTYFLKFETEEDDLKGNAWERAVIETLLAASNKWKHINVHQMTYYSMIDEQETNTLSAVPYFCATILFMSGFAIMSALSRNWVKSKPWVAICGILVSFLGTIAAFGLLSYLGVTCIGINAVVPFIMLGIGLDDTFVILSAWHQTNSMDSVPKRLSETYAEAAVSITITSLTDMLSFYVGFWTPIPSVQIFCAYAGTSVLFIYLMQVFCVGPVLGLSGRLEEKNAHSVFWWVKAMPKSLAGGKSTLFKLFFTGGINKSDPTNVADNEDRAVAVYFRDYHAKAISKKWVQVLILLIFTSYLGVSTWGLLGLQEGLREERAYLDDSYLAKFAILDQKYFRSYRFRVQILITTPLDYSTNETQARIAQLVEDIANSSRYVAPSAFGENWLTSFTSYVSRSAELYDYNVTTEQQFIDVLRTDYFQNNIYEQDVAFNENFTKIIASRFIVQLSDTFTTEDIKDAVVNLRRVAAEQDDIKVVIFNPWILFADQLLLIRPLTIQLLSIAAAIVILVTIIFIPNVVTSVCVFLTIVSTELGVVGLMALWGVALDLISVMCLVMCIGFSVDFSAHISYAYVSSEGTPEQRIQKALYSLGLPILQGGISTIIGISALVFIPSYIYQVFFKVTFLVITCAAWHGLFVLPVLLLLIKPESLQKGKICGKSQKFKVQPT